MPDRDLEKLREIAVSAIGDIREHYSEAQRAAWISALPCPEGWLGILRRQTVFPGLRNNNVVGFMSLTDNGLIDYAFIRPDSQGQGLFREIYQELESFAIGAQMPMLWTNASLVAEPAIKSVGFTAIEKQRVERSGIHLERTRMKKML